MMIENGLIEHRLLIFGDPPMTLDAKSGFRPLVSASEEDGIHSMGLSAGYASVRFHAIAAKNGDPSRRAGEDILEQSAIRARAIPYGIVTHVLVALHEDVFHDRRRENESIPVNSAIPLGCGGSGPRHLLDYRQHLHEEVIRSVGVEKDGGSHVAHHVSTVHHTGVIAAVLGMRVDKQLAIPPRHESLATVLNRQSQLIVEPVAKNVLLIDAFELFDRKFVAETSLHKTVEGSNFRHRNELLLDGAVQRRIRHIGDAGIILAEIRNGFTQIEGRVDLQNEMQIQRAAVYGNDILRYHSPKDDLQVLGIICGQVSRMIHAKACAIIYKHISPLVIYMMLAISFTCANPSFSL